MCFDFLALLVRGMGGFDEVGGTEDVPDKGIEEEEEEDDEGGFFKFFGKIASSFRNSRRSLSGVRGDEPASMIDWYAVDFEVSSLKHVMIDLLPGSMDRSEEGLEVRR